MNAFAAFADAEGASCSDFVEIADGAVATLERDARVVAVIVSNDDDTTELVPLDASRHFDGRADESYVLPRLMHAEFTEPV